MDIYSKKIESAKCKVERKTDRSFAAKRSGFSLVELLIALALAAAIVGVISSVYTAVSRNRTEYQGETEVETEGLEAMGQMTQAVRNANAITAPATSTSGATLTLATATSTSFALATSSLRETLNGVTYPLTGSSTVASAILFTNLTASSTAGLVRIQFTLAQGGYSRTFYGSAAVHFFKQ